VLSGISRAARRSILVRDGAVLEALAGIRQVFLDKTGTLTSGHARLQSIELNGEGAPLQILQWAASLAQASTHPIARAIVDAALARGLSLAAPQQVQEAPGQGLAGQVQGKAMRLGLLAYVQQGRDAGPWAQVCLQQLDYLASSGSFVAVGGELKAMLRLADDVRRETPQTLRRLRARGIDQIVMLTGDRPPTESLQRMQDEHRQLDGVLTDLSQMARDFASRPAEQARADLGRLVAALHGSLERHERDDEQQLYPLLSRYMGGEDPLSPLSHTHREMFRLIHLLTRMSEDFTQAAANPSADEIQHQLIRLDTLAKLHFDQEEALYRYLDQH
jgi:hypothetical protein